MADKEAIQERANIVSSNLVIDQNQSLNFGTFTAVGPGGTVDVNTLGAAVYSPGLNDIALSSPSEAIVRVRGSAGPNIIMSVTNTSVAVSNGAQTMKVNQFHILTTAGGAVETFPLTANTMLVPIGATLSVGPGQAAGTYTGAFTVQAVYQ